MPAGDAAQSGRGAAAADARVPGWRYFAQSDVPPDLGSMGAGVAAMPEPLRRELRDLGLL